LKRVHEHTSEFKKSEGKQPESLEDDKIDVERGKRFQRAGQCVCDSCGVFEGISEVLPQPIETRGGREHSKDEKQVEEAEEEVLGDNGKLNVALRREALTLRQP
jgi:hypothetical protein